MGPKKLTKEEKEALRKAAEEEAARLEAERLAAEEAERLRKAEEDARLAAEEEVRLQAEESLFSAQHLELEPLLQDRAAAMAHEMAAINGRAEWERLLRCERHPDPRVLREVNGFMNTQAEMPCESLEECFAQYETNEAVEQEALLLLATEADADRAERLRGTLQRVCESNTDLLERATAAFLTGSASAAFATSPCTKLALWRSQRDARASKAELGGGFMLEVPRPIAMSAAAVRLTHRLADELTRPGDSRLTAGGIVTLELLSLPPGAKTMRGWTVQFPPAVPVQQAYSMPQPFTVTYELPEGVFLPSGKEEGHEVGWWDTTEKTWILLEVPARVEAGSVTFQTMRLGSFALLHSRSRCFPYKSWRLSPAGESGAVLTLQPMSPEWDGTNVEIVVSDRSASLAQPQLGPSFSDLPPAQLLTKLSQAGINLLPQDVDADACGTRVREIGAEADLAKDMSLLLTACGCSFASSAYNRSAPPRYALVNMTMDHGCQSMVVCRSARGATVIDLPTDTASVVEVVTTTVAVEALPAGDAAQDEQDTTPASPLQTADTGDTSPTDADAAPAADSTEAVPADGVAPEAAVAEAEDVMPPRETTDAAAVVPDGTHGDAHGATEPPEPGPGVTTTIVRLTPPPALPQPLADQLWVDSNVELRRAGTDVLQLQLNAYFAAKGAAEEASFPSPSGERAALLEEALKQLLLRLRLPSVS